MNTQLNHTTVNTLRFEWRSRFIKDTLSICIYIYCLLVQQKDKITTFYYTRSCIIHFKVRN